MTVNATYHRPLFRNIGQLAALGALLAAAFGSGSLVERWQGSDSSASPVSQVIVVPQSDLPIPSLAAQAEFRALAEIAAAAPPSVVAPEAPTVPQIVPWEARTLELAQEAGSNPVFPASEPATGDSIIPSPESQARLAAEAATR